MISTFVTAAHDLGICTLAEGIECSEEAKVCEQLGFDLAQGFLFGRPMPIHDIVKNASYGQTVSGKNPAPPSKTDQKAGIPANRPATVIKSFSKTIGIE
jgi:predicted signal transduction protein with EAL and GGDEF domain